MPATATIGELHTIVQTALGWGGEHLHRFVIHGVEYGICYAGGPSFRDDAHEVRLGELGLRVGERFTYEYNFSAGWVADLRVEQIQLGEPGRVHPRCTGGRRAGPPEGWDGPWAFVEQTQPHLVLDAIVRAAEIMGSCWKPTKTTTWPASVCIETSWPACCRCWAWSVSTVEPSTEPSPLTAPRDAEHEGQRAGHRAPRR